MLKLAGTVAILITALYLTLAQVTAQPPTFKRLIVTFKKDSSSASSLAGLDYKLVETSLSETAKCKLRYTDSAGEVNVAIVDVLAHTTERSLANIMKLILARNDVVRVEEDIIVPHHADM